MATYGWGSGTPVAEGLSEEGYRFEFFEAVRLLEQMAPERTPVGEGMAPDEEAVHFRTEGDQTFAPSDVRDVQMPRDGQPAEVAVSFLSLTGSEGPLPDPYTELVHRRVQRGDTAMRDFFNLLTHRLVALLYRSRKRHHVGMESSSPGESTVARYLRSLAGLGLPAHRQRTSVPDHALLRYADLLNQHPASAHGLEALLSDYFDVDVSTEPLVGRWIDLGGEQHTRIGAMGQSQTLGQSAVLGMRAWDQEGRVRIDVRTSSSGDYLRFLPGRDGHRGLVDLSQVYLARGVDVDLDVKMPAEAVPITPLGSLLGPRLGQGACLGVPQMPKTTSIQPRTFPPELETLRVPIFSMLSPDALQTVVDDLPQLDVGAETHVARQGRSAEALYVVVRGAADVIYQSPDSDESTVLASLEPGDVFGDESAIGGRTYRGSLVTTAPAVLLKVTRDRLDALAEQYPSVERALDAHYVDPRASDDEESMEARVADRLAETEEAGFQSLTPAQWRVIVRDGQVLSVDPGAVLVRQTEHLDALVVLVDGAVASRSAPLKSRAVGLVLNARLLLLREPNAHTIVADAESRVLLVPREALRRLIQKYTFVEDAVRIYLNHRIRA